MAETGTQQPATPSKYYASSLNEWLALETVSNETDEEELQKVRSNRDRLKEKLLESLQMPHVVVLAGSGCSRGVGGPSMGDLWDEAIGKPPSQDAESIANKVGYNMSNGDKNDIELFLSKVEAYLQIKEADAEVMKFLTSCKTKILAKCSSFFTNGGLTAHETFLHRLSRRRARDPRLKIFTTNYDLCFETAAANVGSVVLDGFSFSQPRHYDPRYFSYDIVRRPRSGDDLGNYLEGVFLLYKLHGSVNWERSDNRTIQILDNPDPDKACMIYPAAGKYQQSYTQPYLESVAQYLSAIREPNTCVIVVGFGFNDDHLSAPLLAAVKSNPHLRLIVCSSSAQEDCEGENRCWRELHRLSKDGEDVWVIEATFDAFSKLIPDLKALTPAENLLRAIQGATT